MMYGTVETDEERIEHMMRLRDLQDETGGFTAFITWSYQPEHTEHGGYEATGVDYLRTLALSRIVLDNFDNLQASWVTQGGKVGQLSLAFGANDMGSVMIEENVVRAAGASYCMDEVEIVVNVEDAGFIPKRRNMHYEILGDPIFRERDVPRMLALATARAEGDTSVPEELRNYPARSRQGKALRAGAVDASITADWVLPIATSRFARRVRRRRGWPHHRRRRASARRRRTDLGRVARAAGAGQRPHASRAVVPARARAAEDELQRLGAALMALRRQYPDPAAPEIVDGGARRAIATARRSGTGLVGDISNTLVTVPLLRDSGDAGAGVLRTAGLQRATIRAARVRRGARRSVDALSRRTTCAVEPRARMRRIRCRRALFTAIRARRRCEPRAVTSVHLGESAEEVELSGRGTGRFATLLEQLGVWTDAWQAPPPAIAGRAISSTSASSTPRAGRARRAVRRRRSVAAARARARRWSSCPRSNVMSASARRRSKRSMRWTCDVAFGTDSLASVADLKCSPSLPKRVASRRACRRGGCSRARR